MSNIVDNTFVHWAVTRDLIRHRREADEIAKALGETPQGPPWSDDEILNAHRFCNVSREDDRTTRWIKTNIRDPFNEEASPEVLFQAICLARFVNLPSTLGELLANGSLSPGGVILEKVVETVCELQETGQKSFSAAYMVRSETNKESLAYGKGKIAYICMILDKTRLPRAKTREGFVEELSTQYGWGTFMAGQVAADATYTHLLADAPDHLTWAPLGPGAMKGMNRALGRPINASISQEEYLRVGRQQMEMLPPELVMGRNLTLHDVASNVNCETSKYLRIKHGEGTTRRYQACV